jgi:hypothetical protein
MFSTSRCLENTHHPWPNDFAATGWYLMAAVDHVELDIRRALAQSLGVATGDFRRVVFVTAPGDVEHRSGDFLVLAAIPITGQAATDGDYAAEYLRVSRGETVIQADRLGEAAKKRSLARDPEFAAGFFRHVLHHLVVQPDRFGGTPAGDPAIPYFPVSRSQKKLIRALKRNDYGL